MIEADICPDCGEEFDECGCCDAMLCGCTRDEHQGECDGGSQEDVDEDEG